MNIKKNALSYICLGALLFFIGVGYFMFAVEVFRYRMTVVVSTPTGNIESSSVREVRRHKGIKLFPEMSAHVEVIGEAIVLPLTQQNRVYALMRSRGDKDYGFRVFFQLLARGEKEIILDPEQYPMFVNFRDEHDPRSVYVVTDFSNEVGKAIKIEKVKIEITDDQITWTGIENKLPWLKEIKGRLDGKFLGGLGGLANTLDKGDFIRKKE
ncbi:MAG: hypothetical protein PW788_01020 [Micavibrio sp.]|nr:hypothetical protein [Micavibrio sp.]